VARSRESAAGGAETGTQDAPGVEGAAGAEAEPAEAAPETGAEDPPDPAAADRGEAVAPLSPDDPVIEPETAVPPLAQVAPPRRRAGGFLMPALGGVVAAGLGFGAAVYVLPAIWSPPQTRSDLAELTDALTAQIPRLDAVQAAVATLQANAAGAGDLAAVAEANAALARTLGTAQADLDSVASRQAAIADAVKALEGRMTALEKRPVEGGAASATALEAFGRDMADMRAEIAAGRAAVTEAQGRITAAAEVAASRIKAVEAEAERLKAEATAEATRGTALASIRHVQAALESGAPIGDALAGLAAAGISVPPALTEQAQGVPSLAALRDAYPPAARAALSAALRARSGEAGFWTRLGAFLRSQSGARSLAPRAGDDPDAILSRAEAALRAGDLSAVIAGISALPPEGQAPMAEWIALANRRIAASEAATALVRDSNQGATE